MRKWLKNNFYMKLSSIVIAVIIWLIVGNINDPVISREISGIEVQFTNEKVLDKINKAYELDGSNKISVTVSGKKSIVSRLRAKDFEAKADLSKLSIVDAVPVEVSLDNNKNSQVSIDLGKNTMLKVKVDDVETETIPVNVEVTGEPKTGYAVGQKTASPNMIEVTGPATTLDKVEEVKLTCDVSGANSNVEKKLEPKFYSKKGKEIDASNMKYDENTIDVTVEIWKQKTIPIEVTTTGSVEDGYSVGSVEYEPKTIEIAGPDDELEGINSIELDPIDISGATDDVETNISLPDTLLPGDIIFQENDKNVAVKVKIGKMTQKTFTFTPSDVKVAGAKENQTVTFSDESYEVTISGLENDLKNITLEDLSPHIQLDGQKAGTYQMKLELVDNKNITVQSIDNANLVITEETNSDGKSDSSSEKSSQSEATSTTK